MTGFFRLPVLPAALCALAFSPPVLAQTSSEIEAIRKQIEAIAAGQADMQRQLQEIRNLLRPSQPPANDLLDFRLNIAGAPTKGSPAAKVTLVDFSDFECPFCGQHARETFRLLEREYIDTGKIRYIFRHFPIETIHKNAFKAHEAAMCAGDQGKYWEMHRALFSDQAALDSPSFVRRARLLGLDVSRFETCVSTQTHAARIRDDISEGRRAGVSGTPAFFLGVNLPNEATIKVARMLRGAQPYSAFRTEIDRLLAQAEEQK